MAEPINPLYLKILDACRAQAPEPLYPKPFAIAENLDRNQLDDALDYLRIQGLIRFTDWVQGMGQGYALTEDGASILQNPLLLSKPRPAPALIPDERTQRGDSPWERGEAIRNTLLEPERPVVTQVLLLANLAVFAIGWWLASQRDLSTEYFSGDRNSPEYGALLMEMGSCRRLLIDFGEWWRLFTHAFLHIGALHIAVNMYALFRIGSLVETLFGSWRYALLYLFSALAGGVGAYFSKQGAAAGASGAVSGVLLSMGVWLLMSRRYLPEELAARWQNSIVTNVILLVLISFMPGISWEGHLGGAIGGAVIAVFLHWNRFGVGAIRPIGLVLACSLPLGVIIYFLPREERVNTAYVRLYQPERFELDSRLRAAFNEVPLPLLQGSMPKSAAVVEAMGFRADQIIDQIAKYRQPFENAADVPSPSARSNVADHLKNLDAWNDMFVFSRKAVSDPKKWNDESWHQLNERWQVVRDTQQALTGPDALVTSFPLPPRKAR